MRSGAGTLRDYITINRPSKISNGRGGLVDSVTVVGRAIPASITVKRGGEEVQARRLAGVTPHEIVMRHDATTATISASDYLTDQHGTVYAVKWSGSLDEGRKRWMLIAAEVGTVSTR